MRWWIVAAVMAMVSVAYAEKKSYLNEKDAGPDFATQGEYSGDITQDGQNLKVGVQIIARGDGKFDAVAYPGGLPGDGWDGNEKIRTQGKTENGETKFEGEHATGIVKNGILTVRDKSNNVLGELKKVVRKSPTLEQKPPSYAVVLFDGTNVDQWNPGKMAEEMLMGVGTKTKDTFGSFTLHLEFRTPFMPYELGQQRGNSGMYLHDQYECQILDSFGLNGLEDECGGLYKVSKPKVNMCFPPLSWQTYDVELTAPKLDGDGKVIEPAKATIKHNGVVIHENASLKVTPGGGQNDQKPGPLYLQDHGDPVRFRNIWIVEKK